MLKSKIPRLVMEMLFRYTPASLVLRSAYGKNLTEAEHACRHTHETVCREMMIRLMLNKQNVYSQSELEERLEYSLSFIDKDLLNGNCGATIFNLVALQANELLNERQSEFSVKFEHLLRWRQISYKLGIDLYTCSLMARKDSHQSPASERIFNWPIVLGTDNNDLNRLFNENKLAENHAHYKASGPVVHPAWLSLMNRIIGREKEFQSAKLDSLYLDPIVQPYPNIAVAELYLEILIAAQLRMILYTKLQSKDDPSVHQVLLERLVSIANAPQYAHKMTQHLQEEINRARFFTRKTNFGIDYICLGDLNPDSSNISLLYSGERWLYYKILKGIFENDKKIMPFTDAFYAYILIKARFRSEFIQINDRPGFKNFMKYEGRKDILIDSDPLLAHARIHLAINNAFQRQNVSAYDLRVKPKNGSNEIVGQIEGIHKTIWENPFKQQAGGVLVSKAEKERLEQTRMALINRAKLTFHFIKEPEERPLHFSTRVSEVRNRKLRDDVKTQADALCGVIEKKETVAPFIKAIDAANNELGCRPEVFAQAFRYIRECSIKNRGIRGKFLAKNQAKNLIVLKHHCGEEFLDIVDGLRYIDESILFMEMGKGDRLGHALALGVNADDWYKSKCYSIILPAHDYLDNIVWLSACVKKYAIEIPDSIRDYLTEQFRKISSSVYGSNHSNIEQFEHAWQLRGDNPKTFCKGYYSSTSKLNAWDRVSRCGLVSDNLRNNRTVANLFYRYHYDNSVRINGTQPVYIKINADYISLVEQLQKKMLEEVTGRGLFIETLPSCNVAINTFKRYDKHPILIFLDPQNNKLTELPLNVSINTDNPGIFDTSLENEFALMAIALKKAKDENGVPRYNPLEIDNWLRHVTQMGMGQVIA